MIAKFSQAVTAFCLLLIFNAGVAHAEMKIGIVDMNRVFNEYYKTKDAQAQYLVLETKANKELNERVEALKKEMEEINKLNTELEKTDLSKELRDAKKKQSNELVAQAKTLDREVVEFRSNKQTKLQDQFLEMRKNIIDEIMKVVNDQIKVRGLDMVFDKSGLSAGAVPVVLFARQDFDISDNVLAILNKSKEKK